jgi:hypothetical protein
MKSEPSGSELTENSMSAGSQKNESLIVQSDHVIVLPCGSVMIYSLSSIAIGVNVIVSVAVSHVSIVNSI